MRYRRFQRGEFNDGCVWDECWCCDVEGVENWYAVRWRADGKLYIARAPLNHESELIGPFDTLDLAFVALELVR